MMTKTRKVQLRAHATGGRLLCWVLMTAAGGVGCGGPGKSVITPAPIPAASSFNSYVGTQGAQIKGTADTGILPQSGMVVLSVDDSAKTFNWENTTNGYYPNPGTLGGTFVASGGFLGLSTVSFGGVGNSLYGANPGLALEIPSRAVLLRAGDDTTPPSFLVPSISSAAATCQAVPTATTFQYVTLPDPSNAIVAKPPFGEPFSGPAYGSVVASSSKGTYNFTNYVSSYLDGTSTNPVPLQSGLCAQTSAGAVVTVPADNANNIPPISMEFGPTGFFMIDQTRFQTANPAISPYGLPAGIGVARPSSALDVSSMTSGKYLGFKFEPFNEQNEVPSQGVTYSITEPVAFGVGASADGGLVGGIFANDDVTKTPLTDTTITFGAQSAGKNGLFQSAAVTVPDPGGVCASSGRGTTGKDAAGSPTCTFPAVIVAGNPEGKFAIFLIANDFVNGSAMGIYLFQQ